MSSEVLATVGVGRQELTLALAELKAESLPRCLEEARGQPGRGRRMGVTNPGAVAGSWVCLGLTRGSLLQKDQFGMYALYSKNKPKSDSLLASHGNTFFKVNPTTRPRSASGRWGCCPELGCSPAQFSCLRCTQRCRCLPGSLLSWAEMWWVLWEGAQHPAAPILFLAEQSEYPSQVAEAMSSRGGELPPSLSALLLSSSRCSWGIRWTWPPTC